MNDKLQKYKQVIHKIITHPNTQSVRDVRVLGLIGLGLLVLIASWSGVRVIETNYELQKRIASEQQKNEIQKLKNDNIKLQNDYYNSDTYLELTARRLYGKAAPGETLIIVPETVALANAPNILDTVEDQAQQELPDNRPQYRKNFDAWMDILFRQGRQSN
jgi:cell division protein FtsB